jgi:hypothetical protein
MDLHLHTPASIDYQEPTVSALDILKRAEAQGLDIVAFTDHNSVRGYAEMWREIEDFELLEYLKRLEPAEEERLREYRRLLGKILLLPGFEFTATFGFHILATFPERTSVRLMEHLLLLLGVPEDRFGSGEVGATSDVLRAYEVLAEHGALVIGAHVNSTHGIAMQGLRFGGQTKIAYTQDEHLHALEVTDLALGPHRRSTARFFSGTKPEYPRRMHCIQGSDAHRLERDAQRETNLGVGDRATEVMLPKPSFEALKALFLSDDFSRTRPYQPQTAIEDAVRAARSDGNTLIQAFHESLSTKRSGLSHILRDAVGMANTDGGTVYVGVSPFEKRPIAGIADPEAAMAELTTEVAKQIAPALEVAVETVESDGKQVMVVQVPRGAEKPYALASGGIFVRRESESAPASRDEIVAMVREASRSSLVSEAAGGGPTTPGSNGSGGDLERQTVETEIPGTELVVPSGVRSSGRRRGRRGGRGRSDGRLEDGAPEPTATAVAPAVATVGGQLEEYAEEVGPDPVAPASGIEILDWFEQDGTRYYTLRDLRNKTIVYNVTQQTERRLWRSAIAQREEQEVDESQVRWQGDYGFWQSYRPRGGERRYYLVYRGDGDPRVFYGVSEEGMDEHWRGVIPAKRG